MCQQSPVIDHIIVFSMQNTTTPNHSLFPSHRNLVSVWWYFFFFISDPLLNSNAYIYIMYYAVSISKANAITYKQDRIRDVFASTT